MARKGGLMDTKCEGMLAMDGKNTMMGTPKNMMGGKKTDMPMKKEHSKMKMG